jgi:hypothetical protein
MGDLLSTPPGLRGGLSSESSSNLRREASVPKIQPPTERTPHLERIGKQGSTTPRMAQKKRAGYELFLLPRIPHLLPVWRTISHRIGRRGAGPAHFRTKGSLPCGAPRRLGVRPFLHALRLGVSRIGGLLRELRLKAKLGNGRQECAVLYKDEPPARGLTMARTWLSHTLLKADAAAQSASRP